MTLYATYPENIVHQIHAKIMIKEPGKFILVLQIKIDRNEVYLKDIYNTIKR